LFTFSGSKVASFDAIPLFAIGSSGNSETLEYLITNGSFVNSTNDCLQRFGHLPTSNKGNAENAETMDSRKEKTPIRY
jgi:hypothetical protein